MDIAIAVGNPKPQSRTLAAARRIAGELAELCDAHITLELDLITLGPGLLGWGDPAVTAAVDRFCAADAVIVASPTYKATYTGLLKLFLDQLPTSGLTGTVALPLMLGAGPHHALAPELLLKPVLVELGATCPVRGLYLLDSNYQDAELPSSWLAQAAAVARLGALT